MKNKNKNFGFSLLEMSIVLVIVSIMISASLIIFDKYSKQSKVRETEERIDQILTAIKRFGKKNGYLPCPATPSTAFSDPNFGVAEVNGFQSCFNATSGVGMVPVTTLGLYPTMALDAWGRRFKYVVVQDYTDNTSTTSLDVEDTDWSELVLGNPANGGFRAPAVIVISFGENGYGAYDGRGGTALEYSSATGLESFNIEKTGSNYYDGNRHFVISPNYNGFDDILGFLSYDQLNSDLMQ